MSEKGEKWREAHLGFEVGNNVRSRLAWNESVQQRIDAGHMNDWDYARKYPKNDVPRWSEVGFGFGLAQADVDLSLGFNPIGVGTNLNL